MHGAMHAAVPGRDMCVLAAHGGSSRLPLEAFHLHHDHNSSHGAV